MNDQQMLGPLREKGSDLPPLYEGLFAFLWGGNRYKLYIRATLAGNIVSGKYGNPWTHDNVRSLPVGRWFGPFYSDHDCQLFIDQFENS